ncbi:MAG: zinc ribbon domain-containing protein [Caldilineaceae bacterium]
MSPEFVNSIATVVGIIVAVFGAFVFAFWAAIGIWTFNDIRTRTRDWLAILLAVVLVLVFPIVGWLLYLMIRPKQTLADAFDRALEEEALLREIEETVACTTCGIPVKTEWVYCPNCHSQLQHSCPNCGNLVRNEWEICVQCGVNQQAAVSRQYKDAAYSQYPGQIPATPSAPLPAQSATQSPAPVPDDDETLPYRPVRVTE